MAVTLLLGIDSQLSILQLVIDSACHLIDLMQSHEYHSLLDVTRCPCNIIIHIPSTFSFYFPNIYVCYVWAVSMCAYYVIMAFQKIVILLLNVLELAKGTL